MRPRFSIIVAVRNNKLQLEVLLNSLANQSIDRNEFEVLIVDAVSTDGTWPLINARSDVVDWSISESDSGIYEAWNKALLHANGEWVCFLGSDDFFASSTILAEVCLALDIALERNCFFAYGLCNLYSWEQGSVVGRYNPTDVDLMRTLKSGRFLLHSGSFHHRSLFERFGNFDQTYKIAGDYAFVLKYLKNGSPYFINKSVINMGISGISSGVNFKHSVILFRECLRAYREVMRGVPWRIYARFILKLFRK